ncbi:MAG: hypothetical protein PHW41_09645, partial [Eubacteriales bacterium]|nr:hypothetical protein [Eubacteriales bacterium]
YLGTQATAAPEQFGYQQTDQRSDLYSTGILLLFLCTGSYELESLEKISSRTLKTIILTCTRFDPNRRYASVRQLRAQLLRFNREITRSPVSFLKGAMLGLCCGIVLCAGLYLFGAIPARPENMPLLSAASDQTLVADASVEPVVFDSPAFEEVVRRQLGVDESTPLYQADLDKITSIYLFGTTFLSSWNDVQNKTQYNSPSQAGTINTLSDIPKLRNLSELSLSYQSISDLTPLKGLHLIRLALNGNLIKDLSPISSMPDLQELLIGQNPIYSIDSLASCASLQRVDLDDTYVVDISPLGAELKCVFLKNTPVIDYSPLLKMTPLRDVFLSNLSENELSILVQLTSLTSLVLVDSLTSIKPILTLKNLKSLALNDSRLTSIDGIEALEKLTYFRIFTDTNIDLTPLTKLPRLSWLDIYKQPISDYSVLFRIASLQTLYCSQAQKVTISTLDFARNFQIFPID